MDAQELEKLAAQKLFEFYLEEMEDLPVYLQMNRIRKLLDIMGGNEKILGAFPIRHKAYENTYKGIHAQIESERSSRKKRKTQDEDTEEEGDYK